MKKNRINHHPITPKGSIWELRRVETVDWWELAYSNLSFLVGKNQSILETHFQVTREKYTSAEKTKFKRKRSIPTISFVQLNRIAREHASITSQFSYITVGLWDIASSHRLVSRPAIDNYDLWVNNFTELLRTIHEISRYTYYEKKFLIIYLKCPFDHPSKGCRSLF